MQDNEKLHPFDIIVKLKISDFEKLLLFKILNLDNTENGCYAKDKYFAQYFDKNIKSVNRCISNLEKKNLIIKTHPNNQRKIKVNLPTHPPRSYRDSNPTVTMNPPDGYRDSNPTVDYNTKDITKENKEEREYSLAFDFLRNNYPERFKKEFQKVYSNKITKGKGKQDFVLRFNNAVTIDIENNKLKWTENSLFARLLNFASRWVDNENKFKKQDEPPRNYSLKVR